MNESALLVTQYRDNKAKIAGLYKEIEAKQDATREKKRQIGQEYRDKIWVIENEERNKQSAIDTDFKAYETEQKAQIQPLSEQIKGIDRIIALLKVDNHSSVEDIKDDQIKQYDERKYFEWLEHLHNDDFLKIRLLIAEGRKPKNKYALMAYGHCLFGKDILPNIPREYNGNTHLNDHNAHAEIEVVLAEKPSVEDVKAYLARNKGKMLADFIGQVKELEEEYKEVTAKYKLKDFRELIQKNEAV